MEKAGEKTRPEMSRRRFMSCSCLAAASALAGPSLPALSGERRIVARHWVGLDDGAVGCRLCPRRCRIPEGGRGFCRVRENSGGTLYTLSYGHPCAVHLDPIEKKPFFHFLPGTASLSLSTVGCNMTCLFCQNWQISQSSPEDLPERFVDPETIARRAVSAGAGSIAFTYGEPVVFYEYMMDIARAGRELGSRSVVVSNGFIEERPLRELCRSVDAIKVDLKAWNPDYYREVCGARLEPVLRSLEIIASEDVWLEIVYLVVPTLNDDPDEIAGMADWIRQTLGEQVPVHLSRFFPTYRMKNLPPTPVSTLDRAWEICRQAGLRHVYTGNVPGGGRETTYCPVCGREVVERSGYRVREVHLEDGRCAYCSAEVSGVWGGI